MSVQAEGRPIKSKGVWGRTLRLIRISNIPWLLIIFSIILGLVATNVALIYPDYQIQIIDGDISRPTVMMAMLILSAAIVLNFAWGYSQYYAQHLIVRRVFDKVWAKILHLPVRIYQDTDPRELISRTSTDTTSFGQIFAVLLTGILSNVFAIYLSIMFVFSYHPMLGYLQLALIPLVILFKVIQGRVLFRISYRLQERLATLTAYLSQILINIPLVKVFVKEEHETKRGQEAIDEYNTTRFRFQTLNLFFAFLDGFLLVINSIIAVLAGVYLIRRGELDVGTWIAFFMYSTTVMAGIQTLLHIWPTLKEVQGSVERVANFMEKDSEPYEGLTMPEGTSDIRFDDVYFSYSSRPVITGASFTIPANSLTAIVGQSGAGKTTLLALLERFFVPDSGQILLGEEDIQNFGVQDWRERFAYITQENNLISGTIRENIVYGMKREVSEEELILAAKKAFIYDRIMEMEEGFETIVLEGGSGLSGGEAQRIALARTMLRQPPIILLDEATANLDAQNQCDVLDSLDELYRGRTTVAVAHRLCTVLHADHIVVLQGGRIIDEGTHEELLNRCPHYADLVVAELREGGEE